MPEEQEETRREISRAVCPICYSRDTVKFGRYKGKQRWHCCDCCYTTTNPRQRKPKRRELKSPPKPRPPSSVELQA